MANTFTLTGNLCRDAELYQTKNGKDYCKFSIANNVGFGDNESVNFFNCVIWHSKRATALQPYLKKGQKVLIEGRMSSSSYEKDGKTVYSFDLHVGSLEFMGNRKNKSNESTESILAQSGATNISVSDKPITY